MSYIPTETHLSCYILWQYSHKYLLHNLLTANITCHTFPLRLISPVIFYDNTCHKYPLHNLLTANITCHTFPLRLISPVIFNYIACRHDDIVQSAILFSFILIILQYSRRLCSSRKASVGLIPHVSLLHLSIIPCITILFLCTFGGKSQKRIHVKCIMW